jgi:isopenicillin-N N-acyltransferase-like protein
VKRPPIRILDVGGSPAAIGAAHGSAYPDEIRHYADERVQLVTDGLWSGGRLSRHDVLSIATAMLPAHERFDAGLHTEMLAMAASAGISPEEAVIVGGFTDFVDTVRAVVGGETPPSVIEDDCTATLVPDGRAGGAGFLAQTWDMHDTATDHVLMLRLHPDDAPAATVFTTTGCLGQIGMNEHGVCVGINNLTALDGQIGVAWTSVVRGMLKASTAREALDVLLAAELAGGHNFLVFDRHGDGYNVEAMPSVRPVTQLGDEPIVHTNHALDPAAAAVHAPKEPGLMASSQARLDTATELLADGPIDTDRLIALTREPEAICQLATPPYHIESSGAAVMRPRTGDFWACWGPPAHNDFEHVQVASTP